MPLPAGYVLETPPSLPKGYVLEDAAAPTESSAPHSMQGTGRPSGGPVSRFLSSAAKAVVEPIKGAYHGLIEGPQNPEEARITSTPITGPVDLRIERFITGPMKSEAHKAAEEFRQADPWSLHPSQEAVWHREKALGHGLAMLIPGVGPAAAQTGEQIGTQYAQGDTAGAWGTGVGSVLPYLIPEAAGRAIKSKLVSQTIPHGQITTLLRPAAADLRFGKDPAAAILSEGITGNTLEQIGDRTYTRLHEVGKQIDTEAKRPVNAAKTVNLSASLKPLDDAMAEAVKAGDRNLFAKLNEVKTELTYNWRAFRNVKGEITLRPTGLRNLKMSPADALQFKRMVGDRIRWTGEPLTGEVNQALGGVYGVTKDRINTAVPGLKELNEKYSNLVGAAKAVERRLPVEARNAHWSLSDILIGTHSVPLAAARHVARLPAVRSRAAAGLYSLPKVVPKRPGAVAAPLTGAAQSLQELQDEARRRRPTVAAAQ